MGVAEFATLWPWAALSLCALAVIAVIVSLRGVARKSAASASTAEADRVGGIRGAMGAPATAAGMSRSARGDEEDRAVRVFISSTFLDMQAERDVLVRQTFPALRARFRARGVELLEVDLRWGITQAEAERGKTLPICLSEVDRCRPHFIGVLGARYGTLISAAHLDDELITRFPVLAHAAGRSVTEIEIMHGVLSDPAAAERAFFFLRDVDASDEASQSESNQKLRDLKARIRASGAAVFTYREPSDLADRITDAFGGALEQRFPDGPTQSVFDRTRRMHAAFAKERRRLHIGGAPYLAALDRWMAQSDASPLLVTGASGAGKSTLLANWAAAHRKTAPRDIVIEHYLAASADSADPLVLLARMWQELNTATNEGEPPPNGERALIEGFRNRLSDASVFAERHGVHITLLLDGLDKLSDQADLRWLPQNLPTRIKLVASCLDGTARTAAESRGWIAIDVKPLGEAERRAFMTQTLANWGKRLATEREQRILAHPLAGAPLFLKTVLEELRFSGVEVDLNDRLDFYLGAGDLPQLFARVLERLEGDCGRDVTSRATSLIWASRAGLEEAEIMAIAGASPLAWATLRNGLGEALRDYEGRVAFGHDYLRNAVAARYLVTPEARQKAHLAIADRFEEREPDARQALEVPFQLNAAEAWDLQEALLTDLERIALLAETNGIALVGFWRALKDRGRDPETLLCDAVEARLPDSVSWSSQDREAARYVSKFLGIVGFAGRRALDLSRTLFEVSLRQLGPDHGDTLERQNDLALLLSERGEREEAQSLMESLLEKEMTLFGANHLRIATVLNNLGSIQLGRGDLAGAQHTFERALATLGDGPGPLLELYSNLAEVVRRRGDLKRGVDLLTAVRNERTHLYGKEDPDTLVVGNNLARALRDMGDLAASQRLNEEILEIQTRIFGIDHPNTMWTKSDLAHLLRLRGDYKNARVLNEQTLAHYTAVYGDQHPQTLIAKNDLAAVLMALGDPVGARPLLEEVIAARLVLFDPNERETLISRGNLASVLVSTGDLAGAREQYELTLQAQRATLGERHSDTLTTAHNLADTIRQSGDAETALALQEQTLQIQTEYLGDVHPETLTTLSNMATTLEQLGRLPEALDLEEHVLDLRLKTLGPEHPSTLIIRAKRAMTMAYLGRVEAAGEELELTHALMLRVLGAQHPHTRALEAVLAERAEQFRSHMS